MAMATRAHSLITDTTRVRNGICAALALAIALVGLLAGPVSAGGPQAYELDHRRGREIAVGNLGTYPAVLVIPGSSYGAATWRTKQVAAADAGVEHFKYSQIGSGDVDGDGDGDLIISAPRHSTVTQEYAGKVVVVPGTLDGPDSRAAYSLDNPIAGSINFGKRLLVADLDRDGFQDVAASSEADGVPQLRIFWGGDAPLSSDNSTVVDIPTGAITSIVAANVDRDPRIELGVIYGGRAKTSAAGAIRGRIYLYDINVEHAATSTAFRRTAAGITAAVTGDVAGGPATDLVLGQPRDSNGRGRVLVYRGTPSGLSAPTFVSQASPGVPGGDSVGDRFGAALAAEDMNGDGLHDVAIGAPAEARGGRVTILYGDRDGLGRGPSAKVDQAMDGVPSGDERGDRFGAAISLMDVDGDGRRDLVIGAPGEDGGFGALTIIRSHSGGRPNLSTSQHVKPENLGIDDTACCGTLGLGNRIGN